MENIRDYAAVPHEYLEEMDALNDAEFGRLVRSLLVYSKEGTPIALCGNERFYAKRVMAREDRFQKSFLDSQDKRSAAGQAGAMARWGNAKDANACDRMPAHPNASEEVRSDADDGNTKPKPKPNTKPKEDTTPRSARSSARAPTFELAVSEALGTGHDELKDSVLRWIAYKRERKQPYEATSVKELLKNIVSLSQQHGDGAVIGLIDESIANSWSGIYADRLARKSRTMTAAEYEANRKANPPTVDMDHLRAVLDSMGGPL